MSITGKIKTLFADSAKTEVLFPRTKVSAVTDDNGIGLNALLDNFNMSLNNLRAEINNSNSSSSSSSGGGYAVGAIYMSTDSTSPASLFGGTWEQLKDRFLVGAGGSYTVDATGGEATHTLTTSEMPSHTHGITNNYLNGGYYGSDYWMVTGNGGLRFTFGHTITSNATGGGAAHNNMPPYLAVYMWKRIA